MGWPHKTSNIHPLFRIELKLLCKINDFVKGNKEKVRVAWEYIPRFIKKGSVGFSAPLLWNSGCLKALNVSKMIQIWSFRKAEISIYSFIPFFWETLDLVCRSICICSFTTFKLSFFKPLRQFEACKLTLSIETFKPQCKKSHSETCNENHAEKTECQMLTPMQWNIFWRSIYHFLYILAFSQDIHSVDWAVKQSMIYD